MDSLSDIGERLIARRRSLGMSQRALGEALGVRQPQVARWEADRYASASLSRVSAVAQALGVTTETTDVQIALEAGATYSTAAPDVQAPLARLGVDAVVIAAFCRSHRIVRFDLFGSVLTPLFSATSDVDVLVTYEPGETPSLMRFADHELELAAIFRHRVDLHTHAAAKRNRNHVVRDAILESAQTVYES